MTPWEEMQMLKTINIVVFDNTSNTCVINISVSASVWSPQAITPKGNPMISADQRGSKKFTNAKYTQDPH